MAADRALGNWIESFLEYTSGIPSPELYRRWAAASAIAGALERRVWTNMSGSDLYPNMFILLVGAPGVGKSKSVIEVQRMWAHTGEFNVAPEGMTKAAFIDQLSSKPKTFNHKGFPFMYNPMLIAAEEFGTLFPDYDLRFVSVVNKTYDCGDILEDRTRGGGTISIDRPHINLISGTQPKYIGDLFPESAYGHGFISRIVMVYAAERVVIDVFKRAKRDEKLGKQLISDLTLIAGLNGEFEWTEEAQREVEEWNRVLDKDAPIHPRLQSYNTRRLIHAVKLAMVLAISRTNEMLVTLEDFNSARNMLFNAENLMPEIFKEMHTSSDANEIDSIHQFLFSYCMENEVKEIPEHKLVNHMLRTIPVNRVTYFLEMLQTSGMMLAGGLNMPGRRTFKPLRPKAE